MKCEICGKPPTHYRYCMSCNNARENGDTVRCAWCGNFRRADAPCFKCNYDGEIEEDRNGNN